MSMRYRLWINSSKNQTREPWICAFASATTPAKQHRKSKWNDFNNSSTNLITILIIHIPTQIYLYSKWKSVSHACITWSETAPLPAPPRQQNNTETTSTVQKSNAGTVNLCLCQRHHASKITHCSKLINCSKIKQSWDWTVLRSNLRPNIPEIELF